MNIVLLGPPGCGKGTQASRLAQLFQGLHLSTGDLVRKEIRSNSFIGLQIKEIVNTGGFPSDELIIELVSKVLDGAQFSVYFYDGFPRTVEQALTLGKMLSQKNQKVDLAIDFQIDEKVLLDRIRSRLLCKTCQAVFHEVSLPPKVEGVCDHCGSRDLIKRDDDDDDIFSRRLSVYHEQTLPVIKYYADMGILKVINADQSLKMVEADLHEVLINSGLSL